ncbi:MAG: hypothetical protein K2X11_17710 [Acetobacteraceae bacterium]|nr:hypothetical protein [Acetobacteraceae bacterium]
MFLAQLLSVPGISADSLLIPALAAFGVVLPAGFPPLSEEMQEVILRTGALP